MYKDLDITLLEQLCPWYRKILDYQEICRTEQACFDALAELINQVADNFFFQTMDESAIAQWEDVFHIIPNPLQETLEFRRMRVLNRISLKTPFTLGFLYQRLDELIGPGLWKVTVDYPNYTLYIESSAENQLYASEVAFTIGKIKPAHIAYINTPVAETGLLLSETVDQMDRFTWNYHLGSWTLGELPFAVEGNKEMMKMPEVPSIQPLLLTGTAKFVAGDVVGARVNGDIPVPWITKNVSGSTLSVVYPAPASVAEAVTRVELLNAEGETLTDCKVYIPMLSKTWIKHTIPVKEGVIGDDGQSDS